MNLPVDWLSNYQSELQQAMIARSIGNEGMARVCARRAAGIIIGEYLERRGFSDLSNSVYALLIKYINLPDVNPEYREIANHFLVKVGKDRTLPMEIDLIREVQILEKALLNIPGQ